MHLASESMKLSSQLQAARKLANCSAKNIRQKIEALLLSKSEGDRIIFRDRVEQEYSD